MVHNTRTRRLASLVQKILTVQCTPKDWFEARDLVRKYLTTTKTTTNWVTGLVYRSIKKPPRGEQELISKAILKLQKIAKGKTVA
jgi:hypothetical protein